MAGESGGMNAIAVFDEVLGRISKIEGFAKEQIDFVMTIFDLLKKTALDIGSVSDKELKGAIDKLVTSLESQDDNVSDGDFLLAVAEGLKFIGNTAAHINPAYAIGVNLAGTAVAGMAALLSESTIIQDVANATIGIFNDIINSLESQGVDFSNSLINPNELNTTLKEVWKDATGKYRDVLKGEAGGKDDILGLDLAISRGNDILYGFDGNDILYGGTGNDKLYGGKGGDQLYGGLGWDRIDGGQGNDWINGGHGHDTLKGGIGDDIYVFKKNDGFDAIHDMSAVNFGNDGGYDVIRFMQAPDTSKETYEYDQDGKLVTVSEVIKGEFVEKEDITFLNIAGVLSINYEEKGSNEEGLISVFGHFNQQHRSIEEIQLTDENGQVTDYITKEDIQVVIQQLNAKAKEKGIILTHDNVKNDSELMNIVMSGWQTA